MMGGFGIGMLLIWLLIIGGVVLLLRSWWRPSPNGTYQADSAVAILERRYASGEISREEFQEMRGELTRRPR